MSNHKQNPAFGRLCDTIAYRHLIAVTGSGVSAGIDNRGSATKALPTWRAVLTELRIGFAGRLENVAPELDLLLHPDVQGADYLIEAATIIREAVGASAFRDAAVKLTMPSERAHSALHDLIEELKPLGIITFNYDVGHETAYQVSRGRRAPHLQRAIYSDEIRLRRILAGDFGARFLLKAHGCVSSPASIVLDRSSYRDVIARQLGYRAFVHHVLARFDALIVGFGLDDPDFDDLLQTFEVNFGGGVRDHVYIWKRGQRRDEEARALLLRRRYGLACIFVDSFEEIRTVIADARSHLGPKLRQTLLDTLMRTEDVAVHRDRRRTAHTGLSELSDAGAQAATQALRTHSQDAALRPCIRAEAVYSLGKVRPTVAGTAEFLLAQVREDVHPEIATYALAALLQIEPAIDRQVAGWLKTAAALWPVCGRIDERFMQLGEGVGHPRSRKYLEALLARWEANRARSRVVRTPQERAGDR